MLFKLQFGGFHGCGQRLDFLLGLAHKVVEEVNIQATLAADYFYRLCLIVGQFFLLVR